MADLEHELLAALTSAPASNTTARRSTRCSRSASTSLRPSFLRMIADILRFNRETPRAAAAGSDDTLTLGEYLERARLLARVPRALHRADGHGDLVGHANRRCWRSRRASSSTSSSSTASSTSNDRPQWQAIKGGSREYVRKLTAPLPPSHPPRTPVQGVRRTADEVMVRTARGRRRALRLRVLRLPQRPGAAAAGAIRRRPSARSSARSPTRRTKRCCTPTRACCRARRSRAPRGTIHLLDTRDNVKRDRVALTYDMNMLQTLDAPVRFLVTLNRDGGHRSRARHPAPSTYHHPVYHRPASRRRSGAREISGVNRTFYCGAYWRYGFHEDGVVSAEWALEGVRARRTRDARAQPVPRWRAPSDRMKSALYTGWVRHRRFGPAQNRFRYRLFMSYLDLAELPQLFDGRWFWSARRAGASPGSGARIFTATRERAARRRRCAISSTQRTGARPRGPDPPAHAPALLRLLLQPRELLLLLRRGRPTRRDHRRGDHEHAMEGASRLRAAGRRGARDAARALALSASRSSSTSRRSCPWTCATTGDFGAPGNGLHVHMENWRDGAAAFDATLDPAARRDRARPRWPRALHPAFR